MESFPIYHIDTFTDRVFRGNPAAVCVLKKWLAKPHLQAIAKENNLPVTAFLMREKNQFKIRWITPEYELDICGHGTLAAGYVIFKFLEPTWEKVELQSQAESFQVLHSNDLITLNFPSLSIEKFTSSVLEQGLGLKPKEVYQHKNERCLAVYSTEDEVVQLKPNVEVLKKLEHRGVIVTAPGNSVDFISRTLYPKKTVVEDQVTGASHCLLVPYWAKQLNKTQLRCWQVSERRGELFCQSQKDRVLMSGKAALYMQGTIQCGQHFCDSSIDL
jgi:PhzF family phenazine biosynthesis protein